MGRIDLDEWEGKEVIRVYLAGRLGEAREVERTLTALGVGGPQRRVPRHERVVLRDLPALLGNEPRVLGMERSRDAAGMIAFGRRDLRIEVLEPPFRLVDCPVERVELLLALGDPAPV